MIASTNSLRIIVCAVCRGSQLTISLTVHITCVTYEKGVVMLVALLYISMLFLKLEDLFGSKSTMTE